MAKQSGMHQIKGKVGEYSYYRQSGISNGLIRSINPAMSGRVKTGEEYANTRLNNAEFGQACRIAAKLISGITPKFRPMILPFAQAKLAKSVLDLIKQTDDAWGERNLDDPQATAVSPLINQLAKNNFDEYGVTLDTDDQDRLVAKSDNVICPAKLAAIGADGYRVRIIPFSLWQGKYDTTQHRYHFSFMDTNVYELAMADNEEDVIQGAAYPPHAPQGSPYTTINGIIVVVMPQRTIGGVENILQQYCTFNMYPYISL